jgi:hypothetical protein
MGIRNDLLRGVKPGISLAEALDWLSSFENVTIPQVARWLQDHDVVRQLGPVRLDWDTTEFGPIRRDPVSDKDRGAILGLLRSGLDAAANYPTGEIDRKTMKLWQTIGWLRDDFWQFVVDQGVQLHADMFSDPDQCPTFLQESNPSTPGDAAAPSAASTNSRDPELGQRERGSLQKQIAALALLLAEKGGRYQKAARPNSNQIAEAVSELLDALPDARTRGVSKSALRESISAGLALLMQ